MGIFSKRRTSLESQLIESYAATWQAMGMSRRESISEAMDAFEAAKKRVLERGLQNEAPNLGDVLLERAKTEPAVKSALDVVRAEGVRDDDIRDWWNRPALEKMMLEHMDEMNNGALWMELTLQGIPPEDAAARVRKVQPYYGDPREGEGEDRPIPVELLSRINAWTERSSSNPAAYKREIEESTTFNALVRAAIRNGEL